MAGSPHARNALRDPPNLRQLAATHPELNKYFRFSRREPLKRTDRFMWEDADAVRCVTDVLLRHHFQLRVALPKEHLLPHLTLRLNYVHFLEDLIGAARWRRDEPCTFHGIDIGAGASCIYPMLLRRLHPEIRLLATELNGASFALAARNWHANFGIADASLPPLDDVDSYAAAAFQLRRVRDGELLLAALRDGEGALFCMCNPPFFDSVEAKATHGKRSFAAVESEVATPGGELAFVLRLVDESLLLRSRVGTYTTMLGRSSTLAPLLKRLRGCADVVAHGSDTFWQGRMSRPVVWWRIGA